MKIPVNLVFEDTISEFTMVKLLESYNPKFQPSISYPGNGFGYIKNNIRGFNEASIAVPFFVLTDLDNYECPMTLKRDWLRVPERRNFIFRIAVREVEAWLIADIEGFSEYTGVSAVNFPDNPELEIDPKQTLINLVRRSRKRVIREDIIPLDENAQIGPNYNGQLMNFVENYWNIERAANRSDSLQRTRLRLGTFEYTLP